MSHYDTLVFVGRFRPFTRAHLTVIRRALDRASRVIVLVGSSDSPRSYRNPFLYEEVVRMIDGALTPDEQQRVVIEPLPDTSYDDAEWVASVQDIVAHHATDGRIGLIGHRKDATSYYLKLFPRWGAVNVENIDGINATDMRMAFFESSNWAIFIGEKLPESTRQFLREFEATDAYDEMVYEYHQVLDYPQKWGKGPFLTADAVVIQAGHVLMIRRGDFPGRGLLALPGGFVDAGEPLLEAALRELTQETSIDVPKGILRANQKASMIFDAPNRDPRAHIVTSAHLFDISSEIARRAGERASTSDGSVVGALSLTKVKGGDDASWAGWVALGDLDPRLIYGDHFHIIRRLLALAA